MDQRTKNLQNRIIGLRPGALEPSVRQTAQLAQVRAHVDKTRAVLDLLRTDDNAATIPFSDARNVLELARDELDRALEQAQIYQEQFT